MDELELYIDDRERKCIDACKQLSNNYIDIYYDIKRLLIGDFVIYKNGVQAVFERKTWDDLASSIKDGRKYNIQKLLELKNETGCKLFYIIEGIPTPFHQNIPLNNLQAHLNHLIWRDNIHILYSVSVDDTLHQLFKLCIHISTLNITNKKQSVQWITKLSPLEVHCNMIACIKGIAYDTAFYWVSKKNITLCQLIKKEVSELTYPSGRKYNVTNLYTFMDQHIDELYLKWMKCIPMIGSKKAKIYCSQISIQDILNKNISNSNIIKYFYI